MASPFANIERVTAATVENVMGEAVLFLPRREGKYSAGGEDPDRPQMQLQAMVTKDGNVQRTDGQSLGADFGFQMMAGEVRVSVKMEHFPAVSDQPRKGDYVQLLERPLQPFYEVAHPIPDNTSRILFHCTKVSAP